MRNAATAMLALVSAFGGRSAAAREAIAVLRSDDLPAYQVPVASFAASIGYPYQIFDLHGDRGRAATVAEELRRDPPPLVVALGAKAAWTARQELPDLPLIYGMVLDPGRYGVEGPNVTGVSMEIPPELVLAQFQLLFPAVRVVGVIASREHGTAQVEAVAAAAARAGYDFVVEYADSPGEVRRAFSRMRRTIEALWLLPDPTVVTPVNFRYLRDVALEARLPVLASSEALVGAGALMCVAPNYHEVGTLLARQARDVLNREDGAPLPAVLTLDTPRVVVNRDALETVGLKLDPVMLDFVDEVLWGSTGR